MVAVVGAWSSRQWNIREAKAVWQSLSFLRAVFSAAAAAAASAPPRALSPAGLRPLRVYAYTIIYFQP